MGVYRLKYQDDQIGSAKEIEFDAIDAGRALIVAKNEARGRLAELWGEGRRICLLRRSSVGDEVWEVSATD